MLALGADDFSISIWRNTMHQPIVVLHDIFGRNLLDLCWLVAEFSPYFGSQKQVQRRTTAVRLLGRWDNLRYQFRPARAARTWRTG
jgi:hypothetical protein